MPPGPDECVFCGIVAGRLPAAVLVEEDAAVAFLDIVPMTPGHALVVPRRHSDDLLGIPADDLEACARLAQRLARAAGQAVGADGVNVVNACGRAAWQTVFHFHLHVLPRRVDDGLTFPPPGGRIPGDPAALAEVAEAWRAALGT